MAAAAWAKGINFGNMLEADSNTLASLALRVVWASNPTRVVMIGPVQWNSPVPATGVDCCDATQLARNREGLDLAAAAAKSTGHPVVVGEFGAYGKAPAAARLRYLSAMPGAPTSSKPCTATPDPDAEPPMRHLAAAGLMALLTQAAPAAEPLPWRGISLSSAEWGEKLPFPGEYGKDYVYPSVASTAYYQAQGMNLMRIAFRWERLQPVLNGDLDPTELGRLRTFVDGTTARGLHVLLDPHNYAAYRDIHVGRPEVPIAAFADFWRRLALVFKDNPRVQFGLVNEPRNMPTETWGQAAQAAIDAIRATGATQLITVPGNGYTGAWSWFESTWYGTPNAQVMGRVRDPLNRMVYEVHQYFDKDGSGTNTECVSPEIGVERLKRFTAWLREHKRQALLGELGGGANAVCEQAVTGALQHLQANADVWTGWLWWAGGPTWGDYFLSLEPTADGRDKPQMRWLRPFLK